MSRLGKLRDQSGLSQRELAKRSGVSRETIAQIETGRSRVMRRQAEKLAPILGTEPGELMLIGAIEVAERRLKSVEARMERSDLPPGEAEEKIGQIWDLLGRVGSEVLGDDPDDLDPGKVRDFNRFHEEIHDRLFRIARENREILVANATPSDAQEQWELFEEEIEKGMRPDLEEGKTE